MDDEYAGIADVYDAWCLEVQEDIGFYVGMCVGTTTPVVELAAGTGRIAVPIARAGFDVIAVDRSEAMLGILRAKAPEFAGVVFEHRAETPRDVSFVVEHRAGERGADARGPQAVVAQARAPLRHELIDALDVEALLRPDVGDSVEVAVLAAEEILALQLEVPIGRVAVRRPFVDRVEDRDVALAGEQVRQFPGLAIARLGAKERGARPPRTLDADVVAGVDEGAERAHPVAPCAARGE